MQFLATDYDGTLFRDRQITDSDRDAIIRFRKAGHKFGIVTGRYLPTILREIERWHLPYDFLICCTGSMLLDGAGHVLCEHLAPRTAVRPLYDLTLQLGGRYFCVSKGLQITWLDTGFPPLYENVKVLPPEKLPLLDGFHETGTCFEDEDTARRFVETVNRDYAELMTAHQNGIYVDVCAPHTGKVRGLREMLAHFGGGGESLFVAGDNLNDLEMIRTFSSFAIDSAREEVRAAATCTAADVAQMVAVLLQRERESTPLNAKFLHRGLV